MLDVMCGRRTGAPGGANMLDAMCGRRTGAPGGANMLDVMCGRRTGAPGGGNMLDAMCGRRTGAPGGGNMLDAMCGRRTGAPGGGNMLDAMCGRRTGAPGGGNMLDAMCGRRTEELLEEAICLRSAVVFTDEKKLKVEEFLPIFGQIKKDKDVGCYEDFLECLKLYDKAEDGKMLSAELSHTLLSLGERLSDKEVDDILKDCLDPEDEDGFVPYAPFLKKVVAGPIFETAE
uniref:Myosin light chain alkali n=1 Tax=Timema poppense TaxID=170557 RepID=A0A7R9HBA6_TIMPO|nr:unnamed protein product [Timema poppensis]